MKFSLIIPVYNTAKFLPDCIESCLHQGDFKLNEDYEIICVNDGSTDNSIQILNNYSGGGENSGHQPSQCRSKRSSE